MNPASNQPQVREPNSFGKRKEPHSIVITRNGRSRHYSINPIYFSILFGFVAMFSVGYFAATTYLILRDDLMSARGARNARMQHEYEDRIAALRSNLDRITSRQLLDQQAIENKVSDLLERQKRLDGRGSAMEAIVEKARGLGIDAQSPSIDPKVTGSIKDDKQASVLNGIENTIDSGFTLRGVPKKQSVALAGNNTAIPDTVRNDFSYNAGSPLFAQVAESIDAIDQNQKQLIGSLRKSSNDKTVEIAKLMKRVGAKIPEKKGSGTQIGGPFEPLGKDAEFSSHVEALDHALDRLNNARKFVRNIPVSNPAPGKSLSSRFGTRIDPFKGTYAMHSGLDFRAKYGAPVYATANGKVIFAGRNGGYGNMVEIRHANGFTTKYAHLSRVLVKKGQQLLAGAKVGKVGSTGRSTGPHLHYEIRRNGTAINPQKYLSVGKKLANLL